MIIQELKRGLIKYGCIVVLIIGCIIQYMMLYKVDEITRVYYDNSQTVIQRQLYEKYGGEFNDEKYNEYVKEFSYYRKISATNADIYREFTSGKIDYETYLDKARNANEASDNISAYAKLMPNIDYVRKDMDNRQLVEQKGYIMLITGGLQTVLLIILLYSYYVIYADDVGDRVNALFRTTANGRTKRVIAKISSAVIITIFEVFVFTLTEYFFVSKWHIITEFDAPLQSLMEFSKYSGNMKLWNCVLLSRLCIVLEAVLIGILVYFVAEMCRNKYPAIMFCLLTLLVKNIYGCNFIRNLLNGRIYIILVAELIMILIMIPVLLVRNRENTKLHYMEDYNVN